MRGLWFIYLFYFLLHAGIVYQGRGTGVGGEEGMVWTEFNWTWRQLHSGKRSSRDSSKMLSPPILLPGTNICRVLLSINTLIIDDTIILFQEQRIMTLAEQSSPCIFTPGCDICVSRRCLSPSSAKLFSVCWIHYFFFFFFHRRSLRFYF